MQTKPILVINGTEEHLQVVIGHAQEMLFHCSIKAPGRTMKVLVPTLHFGLQRLQLHLADLAGIACTRGPGSFTGIRIALATVEGLMRGSSLPVCGLEYLPVLAHDIPSFFSGEAWILTYARKNQVYIQGFSMPGTTALGPPEACSLEKAVTILCSRKVPLLLHGSGAHKNKDFFAPCLPKSVTFLTQGTEPSPEALLQNGLKGTFSTIPIAPLYIRQSDAEDNLSSIAAKRGISLEKARQCIPLF